MPKQGAEEVKKPSEHKTIRCKTLARDPGSYEVTIYERRTNTDHHILPSDIRRLPKWNQS